MEYDFYVETNPHLKTEKTVSLFKKEGFTIRYKYSYIRISKNISPTDNPNNYAWLNFVEHYKSDEMSLEIGTITGEKEEIINFLKYFFNLAKTNNLFAEPMDIYLDSNKSRWIAIESEEDIYEIFDENSPKIRSSI